MNILHKQVRREDAMHEVSPQVLIIKVILEQRRNLDGADVDLAIYQIVTNLYLRMLREDLAWYSHDLGGRVAVRGLVVKAFRGLRIEDEDSRFSS